MNLLFMLFYNHLVDLVYDYDIKGSMVTFDGVKNKCEDSEIFEVVFWETPSMRIIMGVENEKAPS